MSRLFKQIQQAQPKERVLINPIKSSVKQDSKLNLLPFVCIISLFAGIVIAYLYTDRDTQPALSKKEVNAALPFQEKSEILAEDFQQSFPEIADAEVPISEKNLENIPSEETTVLAIDEPFSEEKLVFHPLQWNFVPFRDWLQEHWESVLPKFQEFRNSLHQFAYLDVTQPIPETEISSLEKERLDLIHRFLKKFKVEAVRIDGTYSRIMANGQAFYVNTVVSQRPRLKLTGITSQEMIFKDEYNQEYRKEISQND